MKSDLDSLAGAETAFNSPEKRRPRSTDVIKEPSVGFSLFLVIVYACLVNYPCALWGPPSGDDRVVHLTYFHFFDEQLRTGELYPRWITGLNYGAGSPIFFIQYPLPYYAAAGLQRLFHMPGNLEGQARALGLFLCVSGVLWGVFVWLWCRRLASPLAALLAALGSLTLPYAYTCDVYTRVAIGEYSALAWIPLMLFFSHELRVRRAYAVAGISCAFAMVIFSNVLMAFLAAPFLILYAVCCLGWGRILKTAVLTASALALGATLSSIYLLPMIANSRLFSMAHLVRFGPDIFFYKLHLFPYGQNLFPRTGPRTAVLDLLSWVLGCVVAVALVTRSRRTNVLPDKVLSGIGALCLILICSAPLLSFAGFSGNQEIAGPRVIAVRSQVFLASFLTLEMALLAYAALRSRVQPLAHFLLGSCLVCFFMATRLSAGIWQQLPFLWNLQFPWRLGGLVSIFAVGLLALSLRDYENSQWTMRPPGFVGLIGWTVVISIGGLLVFDTAGSYVHHFPPRILSKVETMYPAYATLSRLPTPEELGPNDGLADGVAFLDGAGAAELRKVDARHLHLQANCVKRCTLVLKLVYYPLWRSSDSSKQALLLSPSSKRPGLTELSLSEGLHQVELQLPRTYAESYGAALSLVATVALFLLFLLPYGRSIFRSPSASS